MMPSRGTDASRTTGGLEARARQERIETRSAGKRGKMQQLRLIALFTVALFALASIVVAQTETGQITGTVVDQSGAAVPNATITVKSAETGITRGAASNGSGAYIVTNLLPGEYTVTAAAPGFAQSAEKVTVTIGSKITADLKLEVGKASTIVEVAGTAVQVNTETQTLSTVVSGNEVRELPTLTRNPYALVATAGNVSDAGAGNRGAGFSINGQRESSTNILLDGAANNNEFTASVGQAVPIDSIQEFSILTSNFTAEYGRAGGGVVNVATKSGTNEFHGSAYEFNRVSRLSSNDFQDNAYGNPKSVFDRNQFGYSVGGPVKKDKLFFFNNTEWIRVRSQANLEAMVADPAVVAASNANTQSFFASYGKLLPTASTVQTYSLNQLRAAGTDLCGTNAGCLALNQDMPVYDLIRFGVPYDAGGGLPQNQYQTVARVDFNLTDKTQMYGRYALQSVNLFNGTVSTSPYQGFNSGETDFNNNGLFSVIHTFSPTWVSQSKVVFNRLNQQQPFAGQPAVPTLYTTSTGSGALLGQSILYPGYDPYTPGNGIPFGGPQNFVQVYEDMSWTHGSHSLRFGGSFEYLRDNRTFGAYETAGEYLGTGPGSAFQDLLAGQLHGFQVAIYPQGKFPGDTVNLPLTQPNFSRSNRYKEPALYAQDAWKLNSRMTLNLGVRWEYYGVQHNKNPQLDSNFYWPDGQINTPQGVAGGKAILAPNSPVGGLWKPEYHDFAPRVGFAWDVFGDGKTALRGGYGIGYERNFGNVTFNAIQNPPNYETVSVTNAQFALPISPSNLGPFSGTSGSITLPRASLRAPLQNIATAYAQTWSASLEHQLTRSVLIAADYTGSKGSKLYDITVENRNGYGNEYLGIPCTYAATEAFYNGGSSSGACVNVLNTQFSGINIRGNNGFSLYNGLNLRSVIDNLGNSGLHLTFNYTWAHAIDNLSTTFSDADTLNNNWGQYVTGMLDAFHPQLNKGNADFDIRHRFVMSGIWDIPAFRNGHGIAKQVLGGWELAPILTIRTGSPYSIFDCSFAYTFCPLAAFAGGVDTSVNKNASPTGTPDTFAYFNVPSNVDHYTSPTYYLSDLGPFPADMTSRNAFRAPGFWDMDLGLYKNFPIGERVRLQIRAEAYNFFNHANMYVEGAGADVSATSTITACKACTGTSTDRRNIQLAAKITF